jgi:hypothetical protein
MTLPPADGKLFFELMWKLQFYVNQERGIHKGISSPEEYASLPTEKKLKAREELWKDATLIEAYVRENPDALPAGELQITHKWKNFIKGSFFIFRHLKKGSIFIGNDNQVYVVHGIQDPLEEVIPSYALPQMVEAVLLPFKGQIIYDGLLSGYSVHFGGGIRSDINHTYTVAKHKNRLISTLESDQPPAVRVKPKKNILPQLKEISTTLGKLKGTGALQTSAFALARASLEASIGDAEGSLSPDEIEALGRKIHKASARLLNLFHIMEEE